MIYSSETEKNKGGYVAPVMGNGNMSFQADFEGTMQHEADHDGIKSNPDLRIWWAGRRYLHKEQRDLVSFGYFGQRIMSGAKNAKCEKFSQELEMKSAVMRTLCEYEHGLSIHTEMFIHHDYNLIAVKKDVSQNAQYNFDYYLCGVEDANSLPELMTAASQVTDKNTIEINYKIDAGMYPYSGKICIFSENEAEAEITGNRFSLKTNGGGIFYILFCDSVANDNYAEYIEQIKANALDKGFEALEREHSSKWLSYMNEGYVTTGVEDIDNTYLTAQYHLKCYTTDWSLPVGLNNASWHGKYFAFDEFYMLMGLLTSNHLRAARKIPAFRHAGLDYAIFRGSAPKRGDEAHYPWETLENGTEGAISGFWYDHVFHMASIACGEYYYYKFSEDKEFLRNIAYPVIKACALFYLKHMLYRTEDGRTIVGKCTDLERLGHSRENAYMTTCGAIKTLQILGETANMLNTDSELAEQCRIAAVELKNGLPDDGEKYIPYAGCEDVSIALLSGTYPFDVIERDSSFQQKGIESYLESENRVGNMYSVGSGVCSWYMTWKALVFTRLGRRQEAFEAIKKAVKNTGYFSEMYEINDMNTLTFYRPWFTTAAGMYIHSVNETLVRYENGMIYIGAGLADEIRDFSCRLAVSNGVVAEVTAKNSCIEKLRLIGNAAKKTMPVAVLNRLSVEKLGDADIKESIGEYTIIQCKLDGEENTEVHV